MSDLQGTWSKWKDAGKDLAGDDKQVRYKIPETAEEEVARRKPSFQFKVAPPSTDAKKKALAEARARQAARVEEGK